VLFGIGKLWAEEPASLSWSFENKAGQGYESSAGKGVFKPLRRAEEIEGVEGKAVRLSRLDALRWEQAQDVVADGRFSIQFWVKVEWASRRYNHGDVLNFITPDNKHPWAWRLGFSQVETRQLPRGSMPLVLHIGEKFDTSPQPVEIEPWQWTHVAYVGDGKMVEIYRNGGLLGAVEYGEEGLPAPGASTGTLQINGSPNYDVTNPQGGVDTQAERTGVWECDLRFDELKLADEPLKPEVQFLPALKEPPAAGQLEEDLAHLEIGQRDHFVLGSLIRQAKQLDNGPDTRSLRTGLLERVAAGIKAAGQGMPALRQQRGLLKLSYWSGADQSEQFYQVYVPKSWEGEAPTALVVALHGGGEDETVLFERYTLEERAEEKGWIVVCPYGRGQVGYRAAGLQDVMDVIAEVEYQWPIDEKRRYAFGHSMGAAGTWNAARARPELFAAVAPIAMWTDRKGVEELKQLPMLWIIGAEDQIFKKFIEEELPGLAEYAGELGAPHTSVILEGYDHGGFLGFQWPTVVEVSLPRIFDFFAGHHR
jgi:predicted esterase